MAKASLRWLLLAVVTAAGVASLAPAPLEATVGQRPRDEGLRLFDAYAASGQTPAVTMAADEFTSLITGVGGRWIAEAPEAERARRRQLVALLALETGAAAAQQGNFKSFDIVEAGCTVLRKGSPTAFERRWMLAAWAVAARHGVEGGPYSTPIGLLGKHVAEHWRSRFPDDPGLRLAHILVGAGGHVFTIRTGIPRERLADLRDHGEPTIAALHALAGDAEFGAEALARAGVLEFALGRLTESRADLEAAQRRATGDAFLANLIGVNLGLVAEGQGRPRDALEAYRAAVVALPGAKASAVALAAHLTLAGQGGEAAAVLATAYDGPPPRCRPYVPGDYGRWCDDPVVLDPWRHPVAPDGHLPQYLQDLRARVGLQAATTPSPAAPNARRFPEPPAAPEPVPGALVPPIAGGPPGQARFGALVHGVAMDVRVEQGHQPVVGLSASDFVVLDNGVPQPVEIAAADQIPLDVSFVMQFFDWPLVDKHVVTKPPSYVYSERSSPTIYPLLRGDLLGLARTLRPTDRVRLIAVDGEGDELWPMQSMREPLPLDRLPVRVVSAKSGDREPSSKSADPPATYGRIQGLYDAVAAALLRPPPPDRRHVVIAYTDGIDGASVLTPTVFQALARESTAVMYLALRSNAREIMAAAGMRPVPDPYRFLWWPPDPQIIQDAARSTGGSVFFHPVGSLTGELRQILDTFRQSYVLRYQPTGVAAPGWHDVTITIARPGKFVVNARRGYNGG